MKDRNTLALAIVALVVLAADWATKLWIHSALFLGETRPVLEGWLYFAHRENAGVAFSLFAGASDAWRTPFLSLVSVAGIVLFLIIARGSRDNITRFAIALVVGGAVGNLGDRLMNGHVTDFVLVSFFPYVFNVADAGITVGGIVLAARMIFGPESSTHPVAATS
jgi:signal peptidase II